MSASWAYSTSVNREQLQGTMAYAAAKCCCQHAEGQLQMDRPVSYVKYRSADNCSGQPYRTPA